jgi:tetratricopeptide (TPR) repeat protein
VQRKKGGTPKYQSPEQWEGKGSVEEKTDVYGLGCVLFEMIEGEPLFKGLTHHLEVQHLYEEPRRATSADPELAEVISSCLRKSPDDRPCFSLLRGRLESIHKRLTGKAFPPSDDAVELSAEELNARGAGFDELGRYDKALECYDEAIEKDPSDFRFYLNRANAHLSLSNYEEAQADYKRAMQIVPNTVEAYLGQGALLAKLKHFKDAISCFNKGLSLNNREPLLYVSLGNIYGQMGCCGEADFYFKKALAINPGQAEAHWGLGNIHSLRGEHRKAEREHEKALKLNPFYAQHFRADK